MHTSLKIDQWIVPVTFLIGRDPNIYLQMHNGRLSITLPTSSTREQGLAFARTREDWMRQNLRQQAPGKKYWKHGTEFLFRGEPVKLQVSGMTLFFGNERINLPSPPPSDLRPLVESYLQRLAEREIRMKVLLVANRLHLPIESVIIKQASAYWGKSSTARVITMDWRLIQAPGFVLDYVIYHELAHQKEMNHSAAFWRIVESWCPDYKTAENWLARHPSIRMY